MIIRSQDKKTICIFGEGCAVEMLGENEDGFLIGMSSGAQDDYDLGYYGTEKKAMAVVSNIYYAAKAGTEFYEMPDAHENTTLDDLYKRKEMSTRTVNVLRRAGYTTIEEVMETDETKLMKARDMGANTMCEVKRVIEKYQRGDL